MDLDSVKSDLVKPEFLAVVLAGFGNELAPLTSNFGGEPCPKALLPVANKPLIEYTLLWLEKSGIKDVLLICPAIHRHALYHHIHSDVSSSSLRIDLQTYDESHGSNVGTCTLLRHFASRIPQDFVLVPCDFLAPPSLPLTILLDKFRIDSISECSIATTCWYASHKPEKGTMPEEWGPVTPPPPIVWEDTSGTLLYVDTPEDVDRNSDELEVKMSLLSRHPRTKLSSSFNDSHVYVCRRSVLELLELKRHFHSFREEFLPWLCKIQYQRSKQQKYRHVIHGIANAASHRLALKHSTLLPQNKDAVPSQPIYDPSSVPPSPTGSDHDHGSEMNLKVGVIIHRAESGFAIRVNNVQNFLEINRRYLSEVAYALPSDPKNRSLIDQKANISADSIIGDSTKISERATIKKSVIGRHCVIGKSARILGCVLLDHCVIEDGAKLEGCILGKNTKVGSKADLSRCVTQAGYEVSAGEIMKGEKMDVSDWTAASNTEDEEDDEDDDSEKSSEDADD